MPPAPVKKAGAAPAITQRVRGALPPQIQRVQEVTNRHVRICLYSRPGQGKTTLIGTGGDRTLFLTADGSSSTDSAAIAGSTSSVWPIGDWNDLQAAYDYLAGGGCKDWDWVWIDTLTLFQDYGLDQIMEDTVAAKPHRSVFLPDKGEFGQNMNRLQKYLRMFKDLPINFGVTCHLMMGTISDEDDAPILAIPALQGKQMTEKMCAHMDVVGHMELKEKDGKLYTVLHCEPDDSYYHKDRYGLGKMVQPTIPKIMSTIDAKRRGMKPASGTTPQKAVAAAKKTQR